MADPEQVAGLELVAGSEQELAVVAQEPVLAAADSELEPDLELAVVDAELEPDLEIPVVDPDLVLDLAVVEPVAGSTAGPFEAAEAFAVVAEDAAVAVVAVDGVVAPGHVVPQVVVGQPAAGQTVAVDVEEFVVAVQIVAVAVGSHELEADLDTEDFDLAVACDQEELDPGSSASHLGQCVQGVAENCII